jgi:transcriptional regulator with XRE-family HTH domain
MMLKRQSNAVIQCHEAALHAREEAEKGVEREGWLMVEQACLNLAASKLFTERLGSFIRNHRPPFKISQVAVDAGQLASTDGLLGTIMIGPLEGKAMGKRKKMDDNQPQPPTKRERRRALRRTTRTRRERGGEWAKTIAARLRVYIADNNLTYAKLEELAGVGSGVIGGIVNGGRTPELYTLNKIAIAFGVTLADLIGDGTAPVVNRVDHSRLTSMPVKYVLDDALHRFADLLGETEPIAADLCAEYPGEEHFTVKVTNWEMSDSVDPPLPYGGYAICVAVQNLVVESGKVYFGLRFVAEPDIYRMWMRRAFNFKDRTELRSESRIPERYPLIVANPPLSTDPAAKIFAVGLACDYYWKRHRVKR